MSANSYRIAIVGAGPSGYYAAQALQSAEDENQSFFVDLYEKLPTPWGLVRSGVAPDHQKIRSISRVFEGIASEENFQLLANVNVGVDISLEELCLFYDAVIVAIGAPEGKLLGLPGENLRNVFSSADFVYWYNGHPSYSALNVDLSGSRAIVIGAGNVAMDVGRMLTLDPRELDTTDTSESALRIFHESLIRDVYITARREPENAAFTAAELRELLELESVGLRVDAREILEAITRAGDSPERAIKSNLDALKAMSLQSRQPCSRQLHLLFQHKPISINGSGEVESVTFQTPHAQIEMPCNLVVTAVGFQPVEFSGLEIVDGHYRNIDGWVGGNLYVVGWAKRGAKGVIGTNKSDAAAVTAKVVHSLKEPKPKIDVLALLRDRGVQVVSQRGWNRINDEELRQGLESGKSRIKLTSVAKMLEVATATN